MGYMSVVVLAANQAADEGESTNFLIPNGTFFVILAIFLTVLGVIGIFVVSPIMKVLRERDNMITKTLTDNRTAAEQFAAADAGYENEMSAARLQASAARDDARAAGRKVIDDMRAGADAEVASTLQTATAQLKQEGDTVGEELRSRVDTLSAALASRILGVEVGSTAAASRSTGR
ncbi:MAG: F0F1 ATP synthase subunit B [Mycobacterium sp.]